MKKMYCWTGRVMGQTSSSLVSGEGKSERRCVLWAFVLIFSFSCVLNIFILARTVSVHEGKLVDGAGEVLGPVFLF